MIDTQRCERAERSNGTKCSGWFWAGDEMTVCDRQDTPDCPEANLADVTADFLATAGFGLRYLTPDEAQLFGAADSAEAAATIVRGYWANIGAHVDAGEGVLVCGTVGTGKTFALALTALAARRFVSHVRYVYSPTLFRLMHQKEGDPVAPYRDAGLLLLDDFGAEYLSEWGQAGLESFIEHRHSNRLATCITTNKSVKDLKEVSQLGRVVDRWREQCKGRVIQIAGESLRGTERGA